MSLASANQVVNGRMDSYASSFLGQRFAITGKVAGTGVLSGQTSFDDQKPTFLIVAPSTHSIVLSDMALAQIAPVAGGPINTVIITDTVNRFDANGTISASVPMRAGQPAVPTGVIFYEIPDADATTSTELFVAQDQSAALIGDSIIFKSNDGVIIPAGGSLLVYNFAAATSPTLVYSFEIIVEPVVQTS